MHDPRLLEMLTYKRPHGSLTELNWATKFIGPYNPQFLGDEKVVMAYLVEILNPDGTQPTVLFSSHVDTVHRKEGRQKVKNHNGIYSKIDGAPLGADDGAGVWLMLELMDAKIPGAYLFHRGEECGGIGSKWMADNCADWLKEFKYAIAFDRKACHSVITHQMRGMCCSTAFAEGLCAALNDLNNSFMYVPDDGGVYTDTAEYVDLIAECTNVSCGYYDEHTERERLDVKHLIALRDAMLLVNWQALPVNRAPGEDDYVPFAFGSKFKTSTNYDYDEDGDALYDMTRSEMEDMCYLDPEAFVMLVRAMLYRGDDPDHKAPVVVKTKMDIEKLFGETPGKHETGMPDFEPRAKFTEATYLDMHDDQAERF